MESVPAVSTLASIGGLVGLCVYDLTYTRTLAFEPAASRCEALGQLGQDEPASE